MPNSISATGVTVASQAELVSTLTTGYQTIYGAGINVAADTPDGELINIYAQTQADLGDLLLQVNAMFDPDQAIGVLLDQRCAINGLQRQGGTFTVTNITLVTSTSLNLYGLDQTVQPVFTVQDNQGNQFQLQETQLGLPPGTSVLAFQAANSGAVLTTPNTITSMVTVVLGVTSVNNPSAATTVGINSEIDQNLRVRRQRSVALPSQGYYEGLYAALNNINGVTANIYENDTGSTDANGVPGHSIWVIVSGSGSAASIGQAIYAKRNAGCGMKGSQSYNVTRPNGSVFTVYWDIVEPQNVFIAFQVTSINGTTPPNIAAILAYLTANLAPGPNVEINIGELTTLIQTADPNTLPTWNTGGISSGQIQTAALSGVAASGTFQIAYNGNTSAAINWNDSIATIQSKVQAVTGLSAATVTGSIASQSLVFNLSAIFDVLGLIYVVNNSMQNSGSAAITFSWNEAFQNILTPSTPQFEFSVEAANIIVLPMQLTPNGQTIAHGGNTLQLTGLGGYAPLTYSIPTNNSGASINAATGLYTSGGTSGVTDTVEVTDAFGNTATTTIRVT